MNSPNRPLQALSRAVFPIYVLHFPITIMGLALFAQLAWPWGLEFLLLAAGVYVLTGLIYLGADRRGPAVYLIGGRPRRRPGRSPGVPLSEPRQLS